MIRFIQNTDEILSGSLESRWITAPDRPRSVAMSRIGNSHTALVAIPYCSDGIHSPSISRIATKSRMPTSELAAPIHASPRPTFCCWLADSLIAASRAYMAPRDRARKRRRRQAAAAGAVVARS